ncbi:MAG: RNA polymerase sigma factor SigZ [Acidobacteriota bacterium]
MQEIKSSEQVWQDYHANLLSFLRHRTGNRDLAEDLLQDVFVKIHSRLETLADGERLQAWLYRIAQNSLIDHYRTAREHEPLPDDLAERWAVEPGEDGDIWQELTTCLRPMVEWLPEPYREALRLSDLEGVPLKDIAAQLNLSLPGVKSRVQRGRTKLKELFLTCCQFEFDGRGQPISYATNCQRTKC